MMLGGGVFEGKRILMYLSDEQTFFLLIWRIRLFWGRGKVPLLFIGR